MKPKQGFSFTFEKYLCRMQFLIFNISGGEILVVMLLVVMLFGSRKIPEIARGLGKGIKQVRNAASDIQNEIMDSSRSDDLQKFEEKIKEEKDKVEEIAGSVKRGLKP